MADPETKPSSVGPTSSEIEQGFRAQMLYAVVFVLAGMAIFFGLIANAFLLGMLLVVAHLAITAWLGHSLWQQDESRKPFAWVCLVPNLAGHVFAILGGVFATERFLFISLAIFTVLLGGVLVRGLATAWIGHEPGAWKDRFFWLGRLFYRPSNNRTDAGDGTRSTVDREFPA